MGRYCFCSKILPGKIALVREHWQKKQAQVHLKMMGYECWLQVSPQGDFMIHYFEGESLQPQECYQKALSKDYFFPQVVPQIENLLDISLPTTSSFIKRAFFYPLLPEKEEAHQRFRKEAMGEKRNRHESMMRAFGVSRLSTWLQSTSDGKYIVVYTERHNTPSSSAARLKQGEGSMAWQEIANILMDHTGLSFDALSPDVEWLTECIQ